MRWALVGLIVFLAALLVGYYWGLKDRKPQTGPRLLPTAAPASSPSGRKSSVTDPDFSSLPKNDRSLTDSVPRGLK